ncbi:hypothetical protein K3165_01450 [Qipengyuania sp. 1XM1-15A]|uniref:hypothetical protein n=1 Tax=Qipengyuania xiamenensis TaxID=2867237 RepID=UPI001C867242|nr:hypothetical protein [Qipengyuania xiamenensis]MBX7531584.1 hypothetical protein [Qipengyuania xiamenensis]
MASGNILLDLSGNRSISKIEARVFFLFGGFLRISRTGFRISRMDCAERGDRLAK